MYWSIRTVYTYLVLIFSNFTNSCVVFLYSKDSRPACRGSSRRRRRVVVEETLGVPSLGGILRCRRTRVLCVRVCVAMFDLKTSVAHWLSRLTSSPFHCRRPIGGSKLHYNKVHPELSGGKPHRLLRIGFGHHFASVRSGGSNFRYQKVS